MCLGLLCYFRVILYFLLENVPKHLKILFFSESISELGNKNVWLYFKRKSETVKIIIGETCSQLAFCYKTLKNIYYCFKATNFENTFFKLENKKE